MADQDNKLPDLNDTSKDKGNPDSGITSPSVDISIGGGGLNTKEMVIAFGTVIIAAAIFFIIKNYVSKMLVASYKKSPRSADMAGWSLFGVLFFATLAAVLGILDSTRFLSLPYLVPIGMAILVSSVMFIVALFSKR